MPDPTPPNPSTLLHRFRSDRKRPPLHPLEKAVLTVVILHLCFLPWAIGTRYLWSQCTSLGLSIVGFILALIPRRYSSDELPVRLPTEDRPQAAIYRLSAWPRLLRFPLFWIGLALMVYLTIQGFNPSYLYEHNAENWWWVRPIDSIAWLPTSVDAPIAISNVWRQLIIYSSAWLLICTLWTGCTRRRTLELLLLALVVNGVILAAAGFFHQFANVGKFFYIYQWVPGCSPFASFTNHNQGAAYFGLIAFLAVSLAIWCRTQGQRTGSKSTPAGVFFFAAVFLSTTVLFTLSRGGSLVLLTVWLILPIWLWFRHRLRPEHSVSNKTVMVSLTILFVAVIGQMARHLDFTTVEIHFRSLTGTAQGLDPSVQSRLDAHAAGRSMLADHWLRGTGAGSFRYLFPQYIRHYPDSYQNGLLYWEHAHSDWLEIPIELGLVGTGLLGAGAIYGAFFLFRRRALWHSLAAPVLLGCTQPLMHGYFDFPLQNPAILSTWCCLTILAIRWVELEIE